MPYLSQFTNTEAYSNQVEVAGNASVVHEDIINQATYGNHCELSTSGTQTILAVYNDVTNGKGMLKIGTRVSDFAIEWGNAQEFYSSAVKHIIPIRLSDTKFAIVFSQDSDDDGFIIAGTVAGTVATLGSAVEFADATTCVTIGADFLDTDKVLIAYQNSTTNQRAVCVTFSGTEATVGTPATLNSTIDNDTYYSYQQLAIHSTTLATVVYRVSSTVTEAVTLSISGTTITVNTGGKASFGGSADIRYPAIGALSTTSFVVAYTDITDTNKGNAQIGTISTTTITAGGSEYNFDSSSNATRLINLSIISSNLFALTYINDSTTNNASIIGSVASTVITFGTALFIYSTGQANSSYPLRLSGTRINLTFTKSGQLTFSFLTKNNNQYVVGMLSQNYRSLILVYMCSKIANTSLSEQIEITSVYINGNNTGLGSGSASLYYNGTLVLNKIFNNSTTNIPLIIPNSPIILKENESLFASLNVQQGSSFLRGSFTVFGLKRS